jgi:CHAT domain-containing protein/predicted negative regulator of RcsB-dependent stress response
MPCTTYKAFCIALSFVSLSFSAFSARSAQSGDEAVLRAMVERYLAAYAREDLDAIAALWSEKSPDLAQAKARLKEFFSLNDKIETKNLEIRRLVVEGERATALVTLEISTVDVRTNSRALASGRETQNLSFIREAGEWRIWRDQSAEEELAARLVTAKDEEERRALMSIEPDIITPSLVKLLIDEGQRLYTGGKISEALLILQFCHQVAEQIGHKTASASSLMLIGNAHNLKGDFDSALAYYDRALKAYEELEDRGRMARVMLGIASVQTTRGQYSLAISTLHKALAEFEAVGDRKNKSIALNNLGTTYYYLKNHAQAAEYYLKALAQYEEIQDERTMASVLGNLGNIQVSQGDFASARNYYERSLALHQKIGNKRSAAIILNCIGEALLLQGRPDEAIDYIQKSLKIKEEIGAKDSIVFSLNDIANAYYARGDFEKAMEHAGRAAAIALQIGYQEQFQRARTTQGRVHFVLNQPREARQAFDDAITSAESLRKSAPGSEREQQIFFEELVLPYHEMVSLLVAQNNPAEALVYAERAKARVLLDVLHGGRVDITKTMSEREREQENGLRAKLNSLNTQLRSESQANRAEQSRIEDLKAKLGKARLAYESFQSELYAAHPDLQIKRGEARPLDLEQASQLLTDTNTALLEYTVADDKSFLFVLTRPTGNFPVDLRVYTIPVKRKQLASLVEQFRQTLATRDPEFRKPALQLYDLLLKPASAQLLGKTSIVIAPDDRLWELPFQALMPNPNRHLLEESAISYAPSLTVLREMMAQLGKRNDSSRTTAELLALGNPALGNQTVERVKLTLRDEKLDPLPQAEREVKSLASLYGAAHSRVYVGGEAREEIAKSEASKFRVLHFATHGILNDASPMYSNLVLTQGSASEDGLLEAWELMNMDLQADLVVLSACETARGRVGAGEGVIGLSWALFVAGSPTTVVSQWKVSSASTAQLMLEFHKNLKTATGQASKATKAGALRAAAIKLMKTSEYRHPFHWAGFIVVGSGK